MQSPRVAAKLTSFVSIVFDLGDHDSAPIRVGRTGRAYLSCPVFDPRRITQSVMVM